MAMKRLNPLHVDKVKRISNQCAFFDLLSMELCSFSAGKSRLEIRVQEKHLQPYGYVHGGVFSSIVDAAAFWAVYPLIDDGIGLTTVEMKLNFLAPASDGHLIAKGRSLRVGKTICLGETSVENGKGTLLAHGLATMMILKGLNFSEDLPPKFLD